MVKHYLKWKKNSKNVTIERFAAYLSCVITKCAAYEAGRLSESYFGAISAEYREISDWLDRARISDEPRHCYEKVNELIDDSVLLKQIGVFDNSSRLARTAAAHFESNDKSYPKPLFGSEKII